jgi:hypothetical protein
VGALLALTPLLVSPLATVITQYQAWLATTTGTAILRGESLLGILATWFRYTGPNWPVQVMGLAALLLPVVRWRGAGADPRFRRLVLASVLVFVVIFNHQAESPSYVIATSGIGIWAVTEGAPWRIALALAALILVSLVATSLVPWHYRHDVLRAYSIQAVPCVACWIGMQVDLWRVGATARGTVPGGSPPA